MLELTVVSGPDAGKCLRLDKGRVTLGRDRRNDVVLRDHYVSAWHGEIFRQELGFVYYDLQSRHGTSISTHDQLVRLRGGDVAQSCFLAHGSSIQIGQTVIHVAVSQEGPPPDAQGDPTPAERFPALGLDEDSEFDAGKTSLGVPTDVLARQFARKDPRLRILMRLSSQLNGLSRLSEIIDRVAEATYVAFPLTSCFHISLAREDGDLGPFVTRMTSARDESPLKSEVLAQSLLLDVYRERRPNLYLRPGTADGLPVDFISGPTTSAMLVPLIGQRKVLGVFAITSGHSDKLFNQHDLELFSVLASNVAFTLERAELTESIYRMFEGFVKASVVAIEARDPTTAGHSERVATYSLALAEEVNRVLSGPLSQWRFGRQDLTELRYAALLHDFGKVGVREAVLNKGQRLSEIRLSLIRQRFEALREAYARHRLDRWVLELIASQKVPDSVTYAAFLEERNQVDERLSTIMRFVESQCCALSRPEGGFSEEELRVASVAFDGHRRALFEADELRDLFSRKGTLNDEEWRDMRSHAEKTGVFLRQIPWSDDLGKIPEIAVAHHEKLDGSGYPRGLRAPEILPQVRIMTIADIFDALTSMDRPYRRAMSVPEAVGILKTEVNDAKLDADLVALFEYRVAPRLGALAQKSQNVDSDIH